MLQHSKSVIKPTSEAEIEDLINENSHLSGYNHKVSFNNSKSQIRNRYEETSSNQSATPQKVDLLKQPSLDIIDDKSDEDEIRMDEAVLQNDFYKNQGDPYNETFYEVVEHRPSQSPGKV